MLHRVRRSLLEPFASRKYKLEAFLKAVRRRGCYMTTDVTDFSQEAFSDTAHSFGYEYTDLRLASSSPDGNEPLFTGKLGFWSLPCGADLCVSDLTSLHDSEHEGTIGRSLTIAVTVESGVTDCAFNDTDRLHLLRNDAAIVSVADGARLASRIRAGDRSRCFLMRVHPDGLMDGQIAEDVDKTLNATSIKPLHLSPRVLALITELMGPASVGGAGRLLAESCALELLARALQADDSYHGFEQSRLTANDHAKVMTVRDRLLADPAAEVTLGDLAREAGMSLTALKSKFPAAFGVPVFSFLRDVRLQHAKKRMEDDGWTVSQAAFFVGYRHQSNFSTAFRRKFGIAPSDLRRR